MPNRTARAPRPRRFRGVRPAPASPCDTLPRGTTVMARARAKEGPGGAAAFEDAFAGLARRARVQLDAFEEGARRLRRARDADSLHDVRVALRRLRALLG